MEWGPPAQSDDPKARLGAVVEFDAAGNYVQDWGGPDHLPREGGLQQRLGGREIRRPILGRPLPFALAQEVER